MAQCLDQEERVAAGHRHQSPGELVVVVSGLGDIGGHVLGVEAAQRKAVRGAVAVKVGEHGSQGMGSVEVCAAVGRDDLHPGVVAEAQQMPQQQERRFGRPVQIVEYQHDGRTGRGEFEQRDDGVEKRVALGVGVGARRRGQVGEYFGQTGNQWE